MFAFSREPQIVDYIVRSFTKDKKILDLFI